jgi:hypothetical protein
MFIIDFKTERIKEVNADEICMFVNDLIALQSEDLLGKRYLFVPNVEAADYILLKSIKLNEESNGTKH